MEKVARTGTGEAYCITSHAERVRLHNIEIQPDMALAFLQWQQIPAKVEFSQRATQRRWGTAWTKSRRVILYRASVWTFLHEIAHIVAGNPGHGPDFGQVLHALYLKWKELES